MRNKEKSVIQKKLEKKVTTPETETASPYAGSSGRGGDSTTTQGHKSWENQFHETEAEDNVEAVVEEGAVTKDVTDEAGTSTTHHTRHKLLTSR